VGFRPQSTLELQLVGYSTSAASGSSQVSRTTLAAVTVFVAAAVSVRFLICALPYFHFDPAQFEDCFSHRFRLIFRICGGILALTCGPFQFWTGLRLRAMMTLPLPDGSSRQSCVGQLARASCDLQAIPPHLWRKTMHLTAQSKRRLPPRSFSVNCSQNFTARKGSPRHFASTAPLAINSCHNPCRRFPKNELVTEITNSASTAMHKITTITVNLPNNTPVFRKRRSNRQTVHFQ
jgi:hypothetical protein